MTQQLPTPDEIVGPAVDAVVAARPRALTYEGGGNLRQRYGNVIEGGLRGQVRIMRGRLATEIVAARLPFAEDTPLRELAASEYWAQLDEGPGVALGRVSTSRTVTNTNSGTTGNFTSGNIRQGEQFRKVANEDKRPIVDEALYEVIETFAVDDVDTIIPPVDVGGGNFQHTQFVILKIQATRPGPHANTPNFQNDPPVVGDFEKVGGFFDPTFVVQDLNAAGGTLGAADSTVRAFAKANYFGQHGPTNKALIAGLLRTNRVAFIAILEDRDLAITRLFPADESWGSGLRYNEFLLQQLKGNQNDELSASIGFGCRVEAGDVANIGIRVKATITLTDPRFNEETSEIVANVQAQLRDYFDNRPDWYYFNFNAIASTMSRSDSRILQTGTPKLFDAFDNSEITVEPPKRPAGTTILLTHYFLLDNGVDLTFQNPV